MGSIGVGRLAKGIVLEGAAREVNTGILECVVVKQIQLIFLKFFKMITNKVGIFYCHFLKHYFLKFQDNNCN